jgi:hypothetical protein
MPETAINEDCNSCGSECDVWAAWKTWVIDPEPEAATMQLSADQYFRAS